MPVLPRVKDYDSLYRQFRWSVPARYNIGVDVCDRWAEKEPDRLAILHARPDGQDEQITYGWLREISNRLANVLHAHGVARGDRVAILLPQLPEVAAIHIAIYKLGAVALPLAVLFGADALTYRLQNSGATALSASPKSDRICPTSNWPSLLTASVKGSSILPTRSRALPRTSPRSTHLPTTRR